MTHSTTIVSDDSDETKKAKLHKALTSGKPVVVKLFLDGCPPCIALQTPWNQLEKYIADHPVAHLLAIESKARDFLVDKNAKNTELFALTGFPTLFMIDKEGKRQPDAKDRDLESMKKYIAHYTKTSKGASKGGGKTRRRVMKRRKTTARRKTQAWRGIRRGIRRGTRRHFKKLRSYLSKRSIRYGLNPTVTH